MGGNFRSETRSNWTMYHNYESAYTESKAGAEKSEYPNGYHVRNVTNSEKHPRIPREKPVQPEAFALPHVPPQTKLPPSNLINLLSPVVRVVPLNFKQVYGATKNSAADRRPSGDFPHLEQYYSKKKRRKTEQEKLIASLTRTELPHVDGAFKRSTTIRYRNLNEDRLLDNLFDSREGKPRRSSGKKVVCIGDIPSDIGELEGVTKQAEAKAVPENAGDGGKRLTTGSPIEQKKRRKTEKEKLIENLSAIERIHVDGAFKRNAYNVSCMGNVSEAKDESRGSGNLFSPVRFVGLDGDIESLILEKTGSDAT